MLTRECYSYLFPTVHHSGSQLAENAWVSFPIDASWASEVATEPAIQAGIRHA